jgi:hypothetical protein
MEAQTLEGISVVKIFFQPNEHRPGHRPDRLGEQCHPRLMPAHPTAGHRQYNA